MSIEQLYIYIYREREREKEIEKDYSQLILLLYDVVYWLIYLSIIHYETDTYIYLKENEIAAKIQRHIFQNNSCTQNSCTYFIHHQTIIAFLYFRLSQFYFPLLYLRTLYILSLTCLSNKLSPTHTSNKNSLTKEANTFIHIYTHIWTSLLIIYLEAVFNI